MTRALTEAISPFFVVRDIEQTITFYRDKLGFEVRFQAPAPDPFFAILGRDGVQLFVKSNRGTLPVPNHTLHPYMAWDAYVYVPDPDALAAEFW